MAIEPDVKIGESGDISVVDFGPFLDGTGKQKVADALLDSFKRVGFVYLVNHGIPQEKVDEMFTWSKRFFALPMEKKMLAPHPPDGRYNRGYSPPGFEKATQHVYDAEELAKQRTKAPDANESFGSGKEDHPMLKNIWPPDDVLPGYREACLTAFWTFHETQLHILRALALGFKLPEDYFVKYHQTAENMLRFLHYPSVPTKKLLNQEVERIGAHSDFGSVTLLLQDHIGGLEVEDPHNPGQFKSAPPVPGALIVNAGDFLMRWSNDTIRSTVHRVTAPPGISTLDDLTPDRYSIPYFCSADFETVIDCIPGTYSEERPRKYEPTSAGEYLMKRLAALY